MLSINRFQRLEAARRRTLPRADDGKQAEWPLVLVEHGAKGTRISAANPAAFEAGAAIGQALTDARAGCPALRVEQADAEADRELLEGLARWAMRYSPIVAVDGTDGLFIDTTGCDHLFGGEAGLVGDCLRRLRDAGFCVLAGLADTPGLAWGLARYGHGAEIVESGMTLERAIGLPVEALRLSAERLLLLRRLGLKTVGAVAAVPRAALERRFRSREAAQSVQLRLDQMTGAIREPLDPLYPPLPCRAFFAMPEPVIDVSGIEFALDELLVRLSHRLERDGQGARCFRLTAFRADGGSSVVAVRLSRPGRAVQPVKRLFADRLQEIDCGFGIDGFLLAADDLERVVAEQQAMVADRGDAAGADDPRVFSDGIAPLVDVLANRIGARNIHQWAPVAT
ncbi:MAG TPA: DNA polymerase Y family protein, partial [Pararhizobium sp.]|nr:DNA polymerase Y family protein [Pararhizobium sp.]